MILPVFIPHWGCPQQCIFCNQGTITGEHESSLQGARKQLEELTTWVRPSVDNELAYYGGSFTALPMHHQEQLLELAEEYRRKGYFGAMRLSTRPDAITEPILALLKAHEVKTIELGAQSLDDQVLQRARRGHTAKDVWDASRTIRAAGFQLGLQLMTGLPGQTEESLRDTLQQVLAIHPDIVRIYPVLVIDHTPLAEQYRAGNYAPLTVEEAAAQSWLLLEALEQAGIRVIRIGLQPDKDLCAPGHILAGPFHPAFGEIVRSYGIREWVSKKIAQLPPKNYNMVITCPQALDSRVRGQHRCNILYWERTGQISVQILRGEKFEVNFYDSKTV